MVYCSPKVFHELVRSLVMQIVHTQYTGVYGVPRGGIYVAIALSRSLSIPIIEKNHITDLTLIVDDLIDSGKTRSRYPNNDFACLYNKKRSLLNKGFKGKNYIALEIENDWVEFFWEKENNEQPGEDAVIRILQSRNLETTKENIKHLHVYINEFPTNKETTWS